ncbi:MAG: phenylacetate-CoA oxygenase, PaaI subunit [Gemmatimonadetes bacterium]|nr:phenylacetate-CoA oxygenase, PaaI subunit [Gemmatimonadota bacterium]
MTAPAPSINPPPREPANALFEYLLRLGDDRLVLGHRLSEWCGHGPILEEDIALSNIALDLLGQATIYLKMAGEVEGKGRDEDALAFFREVVDFRNAHLCELPRGDFGFTIVRQFLFDAYDAILLEFLLKSTHEELAAFASKAIKEARYHVRHSGEWVIKLGDGTTESHRRAQAALDALWKYTPELFTCDAIDAELEARGIAPDQALVQAKWNEVVRDVLARATLTVPEKAVATRGGRQGRHTEHLGLMLAEMQSTARAHPGAKW